MNDCAQYQFYSFVLLCILIAYGITCMKWSSTPTSSRFFEDWQDFLKALNAAKTAEQKREITRLLRAQVGRTGILTVTLTAFPLGLSYIGSLCSDTLDKIKAIGFILIDLVRYFLAPSSK